MLPDVQEMGDHMEIEPQADRLEKAETQEWTAKLQVFEAKLHCDQKKVQEIASGVDTLRDVLDWIQTSKRVKQAEACRGLVEAHMARTFPVVDLGDISELPGKLADHVGENNEVQDQVEDKVGSGQVKKSANKRLIVILVDFNVPGVAWLFFYCCAHAM